MRYLSALAVGALLVDVVACPVALAQEHATMSVTVIAKGTDATRSDGEWSKGTFSYRAQLTATLQTDGELTNVNMYDPEYGQKAMAQAARAMTKIQNAMQGRFSDEEEEPEAENRYLLYTGQLDCPTTLSIQVDEKVEGEYADVGGMQPYTQTFTANSTGTTDERNIICVSSTSMLDIKDNTLYRSSLGFPDVRGHYLFSEKNRGTRQDNKDAQHHALPKIVSEYLFNTLRVAPATGRKTATLTPTEPVLTRVGVYDSYEGTIDVDISWDFVRPK